MSETLTVKPIIVIIATSLKRTELLLNRSLKSVYLQKDIFPMEIYIVDDNIIKDKEEFSKEYFKIKKGVENLRKDLLYSRFRSSKLSHLNFKDFFKTTVIKNERTQGHSGTGAWNTGAFKSIQNYQDDSFLAFLDDDDEWDSEYLKTVYSQVQIKRSVEVVGYISGIRRIEKSKEVLIKIDKEKFNVESFFIGNPGFQGSNTFIRLKDFWKIGGYDESLKSTVDRDFAIRLLEYLSLNSKNCIILGDKYLVTHYATSLKRVTCIPKIKQEGLDVFYYKHFHKFNKKLQVKSLERAKRIFAYKKDRRGYDVKVQLYQSNDVSTTKEEVTPKKFNLVIGIISDNYINIKALLESFYYVYSADKKYINSHKIIILENLEKNNKFRETIKYCRDRFNLNIELIPCLGNKLYIAQARTKLQRFIYFEGAKKYNGEYITWITDDDNLFYQEEEFKLNYFQIIQDNNNKKIDALFGGVIEAPPLPFFSTLRTQFIDFYYNLTLFKSCDHKAKFFLNNFLKESKKRGDFYYDFSSITYQHLEYPYYINLNEENYLATFEHLMRKGEELLTGITSFRKLSLEKEFIGEIRGESIYRGGNTIIYNPELLKTPNYTPTNQYNRRSDFNWSLINQVIKRFSLLSINLPLIHNRCESNIYMDFQLNKLYADIRGIVFYRVFNYILQNLDTLEDYDRCIHFFEEIKNNTLTKIQLSFYRIETLMRLINETMKEMSYRDELSIFKGAIWGNLEKLKDLENQINFKELYKNLDIIQSKFTINKVFIDKVIREVKEIIHE